MTKKSSGRVRRRRVPGSSVRRSGAELEPKRGTSSPARGWARRRINFRLTPLRFELSGGDAFCIRRVETGPACGREVFLSFALALVYAAEDDVVARVQARVVR